MSRKLLLPLLMALVACMGSECSGGSSSGSSGAKSSSSTSGIDKNDHIEAQAPVPEPSAALIFGLGLLVAGIATRRKD
jgi:hypothetical protein